MNHTKNKFVLYVLCLALITTFFSACNATNDEPTSSTLSPEQLTLMKQEEEEKKLQNFTDKFYNSYSNDNFDVDNISLTFAVLSDLHIGLHEQVQKVENSMKFLSKRTPNGLDAVLLNGDITNSFDASSNEEQIISARDVLVNNLPENTVFFYSLGPSHDCGGYDKVSSPDGDKAREAFINVLGDRFHVADIEDENEMKKGMKHAIINDYHFLSLDVEKADYSTKALNWIRSELKKITTKEPNKPVFVMTHIPAYDSLSKILNDFPQVIYFSGHEHIPFNTPASIFQAKYTSLSIGGLAYYREASVDSLSNHDNNNNYEYGQGYLIEVDKNANTRVLRFDFYNEEVLDESWVIPSPKDDGSHLDYYTNKKINKVAKPEFPKDAEISIAVDENDPFAPVEITFPAATTEDGYPVTHYVLDITIVEGSGSSDSITKDISSMYMKHPNNKNMPESYTVTVDGVAKPYLYSVSIKAYNCREKASAALEGQLKSEGFSDVERN